ncbi:MAG: M81 family metallopeptidase [Planctomycetes bacterium]|nr:M81 family metallopeptidase [Planctomycetota bacterium]
MRIAIGGIWHETNTFASAPSSREQFDVLEGAALLDSFRNTRTPLGGFIEGARATRMEILPALFASAVPSGSVRLDAYEEFAKRLIDRLAEIRPDGLLLDLHGAMVVEGIDDVEGDLLGRIRARLGELPIGAVLDFHANIGDLFVRRVDIFAGYDTYPHVDPVDRGVEVAGLLARKLSGALRPTRAIARPPLLTAPQAQRTDTGPMGDLMKMAAAFERQEGVLSVTVAGGFPYADVPHAGLSAVATTDGRPDLAESIARDVARAAWEARGRFRVANLPPEEAVARALRHAEGPVILVDVADNVGGGSPGDGTVLLDALLRAKAKGSVVTLADPDAVARAFDSGEGASIDVLVGGKTDRLHGDPVRLQARVARLGSGDFTYKGSYMTSRKVQAGRAALLDSDGVRVLIREKKVMPFDREEIQVMGIDPAQCRIIVVKSALAWRAAYGELARAVLDVDTPGICSARLETLPFRRVRRPIAPLDPEVAYDP